jgi:aryl-alcohol dehydrogenase-like predicted oxidoreductase
MIPKQAFGRTGHLSTRVIFGGAALGHVDQAEADRAISLLLELGVNHIDTAAVYGDGELRLGPWMARHRQDFFLATKTIQRTYQAARDQIHASLERMRVDSVDLLQLHNLTNPQEWEVAMGPGGALEAIIEAREQGLTRYLGVTGHGLSAPAMHRRSLERFDFDSVLLPYNFVTTRDEAYARDFDALQPICEERGVAIQTIKSIVRIPRGGKPGVTPPYYEPLEEQADIDRAVHWVLGRPGIFLNSTTHIGMMPKVMDAAGRFQNRPSDEEMARMVERVGMIPLFA